jgi:hypothetical protein
VKTHAIDDGRLTPEVCNLSHVCIGAHLIPPERI